MRFQGAAAKALIYIKYLTHSDETSLFPSSRFGASTRPMTRPRVLLLAERCNPEQPSLPIVGYKYARALSEYADVTLVTQIRNKVAIERAANFEAPIHYVDTEWVARPLLKLASRLRGNSELAWSTQTIVNYPTYIAFELQAWAQFKKRIRAGEFDLVHRITPMTPTWPSPMAGRGGVPFVIGPLNGNLDWPDAFRAELKREREGLRRFRDFYKYMPYARSTQRRSTCLLAAFQHTIDDLQAANPSRIVPFPEVGFDPEIFHSRREKAPFSGSGPFEFLYAGRLVPYKLPELPIRTFAASERLRQHKLTIVGAGPEMPRLEALVAEHGLQNVVTFEGGKSQAEVADAMRRADAFVFPSIRELGAGVVVEAMATGILPIVTDYGAPADLCANGRGVKVPLAGLDDLIEANRIAMEACLDAPEKHAAMTEVAKTYASENYTWAAKAEYTVKLYDAVMAGEDLTRFREYA